MARKREMIDLSDDISIDKKIFDKWYAKACRIEFMPLDTFKEELTDCLTLGATGWGRFIFDVEKQEKKGRIVDHRPERAAQERAEREAERARLEAEEEERLAAEWEEDNPFDVEDRATQAEGLPEGWIWHDYDDGSGCLRSPAGERVSSYDLSTGEVREPSGRWGGIGNLEYMQRRIEMQVRNDVLPLMAVSDAYSKVFPHDEKMFAISRAYRMPDGIISQPENPTHVALSPKLRMDKAAFDTLYARASDAEERNFSDYTTSRPQFASRILGAVENGSMQFDFEGETFDLSNAFELGTITRTSPDKLLDYHREVAVEMQKIEALAPDKLFENMTDGEKQGVVARMANSHARWLSDDPVIHATGEQADFSGMDLRELSLSYADFSNAIFDGAKFEGNWTNNTNFSGASFKDVNMVDMRFSEVDLTGAVLDGAKMAGISFDHVNADGASFEGVSLSYCGIGNTSFDNTNFAGANLDNVRAHDNTSFEQANFDGAKMSNTELTEGEEPKHVAEKEFSLKSEAADMREAAEALGSEGKDEQDVDRDVHAER